MAKIVIFGNGEAPIKSINYLINENHSLLIVVDPQDTGTDTWQKSLLKYCRENNIFFVQPVSIGSENLYARLKKFTPEVIFSIQCRSLIKKDIIHIVDGEIFNFHFANLPKNRGCYPGFWHIISGDKYAGITLHKLTTGIDDGEILDKEKKKILCTDTTKSIYFWCIQKVEKLLKRNLQNILQKSYKTRKQDSFKASYYSRNSVRFDNLFVNWNQSGERIARFIQAYTFPPLQLPKTRFNGTVIEISAVISISMKKQKYMPGTVLSFKKNQIEAQTEDGSILVEVNTNTEKIESQKLLYL